MHRATKQCFVSQFRKNHRTGHGPPILRSGVTGESDWILIAGIYGVQSRSELRLSAVRGADADRRRFSHEACHLALISAWRLCAWLKLWL